MDIQTGATHLKTRKTGKKFFLNVVEMVELENVETHWMLIDFDT